MVILFSLLLYVCRATAIPFVPVVGPVIRAAMSPSKVGTMEEELGSPEFWYKMIASIILVLAGGVFAGYVLRELEQKWYSTCLQIDFGTDGLR
jgi:hypothetical protein